MPRRRHTRRGWCRARHNGPLYQLRRGSDGVTIDIMPIGAGQVANATARDSFCSGTTCLVPVIYNQSRFGTHLTVAPPGCADSGPHPNGYGDASKATSAPVTLKGCKAYNVFIRPKSGYGNDATSGVAAGDAAQHMYRLSTMM